MEREGEEDEEEEEEEEDEMVARGQFRRRSARKSEEDEAAASLGKRSSRRCGRGSGRRAGGDEVASGATPAAEEEEEEEGDRPKYGFRDRRTLKRTQFFTYDKVLNIILFLTINSVVARQKTLPELGEPNHGMVVTIQLLYSTVNRALCYRRDGFFFTGFLFAFPWRRGAFSESFVIFVSVYLSYS